MRKRKSNQSVNFAKRLKSLMITRQLTQQKVADAAGVSRTAVVKWLRGSIPGSAELFNLASAVGVSIEWFFEVIPNRTPTEAETDKMQIMSVPVDALAPDLKKQIVGNAEMAITPGFVEAVAKAFSEWLQTSAKKNLTSITLKGNNAGVQSEIQKLVNQLKRVTAAKGKKAELSRFMGVAPARISEWLSGEKKPGGEYTLRLLNWVEQQERQK